jgi:2-polyprenyl-3-methyl-5-hydroxy-6-metoxy-1,4-benzoquinol methylase
MAPVSNPWDTYADEYARELQRRGPLTADTNVLVARLLSLLGDIKGKAVLDAACGNGALARLLHDHEATVTGLDLSSRLIVQAKEMDPRRTITYEVADLSQPQPVYADRFDAIGSYLALNDIGDHHGFARSLAHMARPGAPIALAFNNPYSAVIREHVTDYSASGTVARYGGMWQRGIKASYVHRTLEDILDAFLAAGLVLVKLVDIPDTQDRDWLLPVGTRFPMFMVLGFRKPEHLNSRSD